MGFPESSPRSWLLPVVRQWYRGARLEEQFLGPAEFAARLEQHLDKIDTRERRHRFLRGLLKMASHLKLEGDEQDG
jgi:hypothetical protein